MKMNQTKDKQKAYTSEHERTARFARTLGHPARVAIIEFLLKNADKCCFSGDMAEFLPIARSTLSAHLKELKNAGLIQGEINPPFIKYCINLDNWNEARNLFGELYNAHK